MSVNEYLQKVKKVDITKRRPYDGLQPNGEDTYSKDKDDQDGSQ